MRFGVARAGEGFGFDGAHVGLGLADFFLAIGLGLHAGAQAHGFGLRLRFGHLRLGAAHFFRAAGLGFHLRQMGAGGGHLHFGFGQAGGGAEGFHAFGFALFGFGFALGHFQAGIGQQQLFGGIVARAALLRFGGLDFHDQLFLRSGFCGDDGRLRPLRALP